MITNVNSSAYYYNDTANFASAYGYIDPLACVTQAGYGYNGRIAQPCDKGSWNPNGTRSTCTPCDYGYTTASVGGTVDSVNDPSGIIGDSASDCGVAAGFGYYNFSGTATLVPCPRGTFNNDTWDSNTTAECTSCTSLGGAGLFTLATGSDSTADCSGECWPPPLPCRQDLCMQLPSILRLWLISVWEGLCRQLCSNTCEHALTLNVCGCCCPVVCAGGYGGANCATQCGGGTGDLATVSSQVFCCTS